ncbi:ribosome maturation factor RimP [Carbonactinospora thermoautotrophica]|uniref:Ribosome maturation factor RimP n=1 Tax=Carbonactinospora thermoautotrophica TaxID=1469144 RepID=A0A132N301_9ACTN|nr:ribosome maturation factor RimP [Carbonactinospora thermoautotrophica]KWW99700.1 Ribosome maturation factor RimP [Carbonactinospora thermoautotrophica]KWX04525.1 ribosome maturation factor RimP [Carbonactinospora thermoautotrophica]KWX10163.1 ribosome maturation factor RimP [Carbonactinospora thermoautotrophica]MCX9191294.1 ribosome maturation factor RimP [Carbonactinospora thermoautotrophica]
MSLSSVRDRVYRLLEPVVTEAGMDLEDVVLTPAGKRRILRVVVDQDGGVTLDDVAELSRVVSQTLDASDVMGGAPYVLEVTSPGVDRPLVLPRHWRRAESRLVQVTLKDGTQLLGRVLDTDEEGATLEVRETPRRVVYSDVARAKVQVEFARSGQAGVDAEMDEEA